MRSKLFFVFLVAAILATSHANPNASIQASKALIGEICKTTINPSFCLNFLNSDPRTATADVVGLARITIDKAESNVKATANLITGLLAKANDPRLKGLYQSCLENFNDATSDLDQAKAAVASGGRGDVNNFASAALTDVDTCKDDINGQPPQLAGSIQKLENIIGVVLAISNRL